MSQTSIQTVGGSLFDPYDPDPALITAEEISHALSQLCRFSGHTVHFYSVAQHSVMAYRLAAQYGDANIALAALMHDASEAYLGDVTRPLKRMLGRNYSDVEHEVMKVIATKYRFDWPMTDEVRKIDNDLLETEFVHVMGGKHPDCAKYGTVRNYTYLDFSEWSPRKAKREFLDAFDHLTSQMEFEFSQKEALDRAMKGYKEASAKIDPPAHTKGRDAYFRGLNDGSR